MAPCGTYRGYKQHRRNKELPCTECRDANRDYVHDWRADHLGNPTKDALGQIAAKRALDQLKARHPDEFAKLHNTERQRAGLAPLGVYA